jgi:drug/metabolite transporter (DMT)-like permease
MVSWGVGQVVAKQATDRLGAVTMVLLASLLDGSAYVVLFLLFGGPFGATWDIYAIAGLAAVVGMAGYILYYEAMLRGSVAVVGTVSAGSPILAILGGMAFFGETPSASQAVGLILLVLVVLILGYEPVGRQWKVPVAVVLSVGVLTMWGVWGLLTKVAVDAPGFGPWNILLFYTLANVTMGPPYYLWRHRRSTSPDPSRRTYGAAVLGLGLLAIGIVAATVALSLGPVSLVSAVSGCYPVVTALIAFAFLRERVTLLRVLAITLFVPGIVLVAL